MLSGWDGNPTQEKRGPKLGTGTGQLGPRHPSPHYPRARGGVPAVRNTSHQGTRPPGGPEIG